MFYKIFKLFLSIAFRCHKLCTDKYWNLNFAAPNIILLTNFPKVT